MDVRGFRVRKLFDCGASFKYLLVGIFLSGDKSSEVGEQKGIGPAMRKDYYPRLPDRQVFDFLAMR
jgi:hypothetical protein